MSTAATTEPEGLTRFKEMLVLTDPNEIYLRAKELYAEDAYFNDALEELRGAEAIAAYLQTSMKKISHWEVTFDDTARSNDNQYVRWSATYSLRIRKNRLIETTGISHLRFNEQGRVSYQRDYWDPISGLFEHLPVAGSIIRFLMRFM